jgi:hypothetical protein
MNDSQGEVLDPHNSSKREDFFGCGQAGASPPSGGVWLRLCCSVGQAIRLSSRSQSSQARPANPVLASIN